MPTILQHAVARLTAGAVDPRTDAALVAAFLHAADEAAFAELVRRHGPAVLGVCRRVLGATPDAEDAFQATFLVLVRRARHTDWHPALGPWLYGVALRVARKARAARARRRANERQVTAVTPDAPAPPAEPDDSAAAIDEELAALPAVYRVPLVLCEIQSVSRRDAAQQLGLAEGTLSSRLARGRKLLRDRLARRGVVPAVAGLAVAVPAGLTTATVRSAVGLLTCAAGAVPVAVLSLTEGVVKTMIVKWKLAAVLVAACVGLSGFGAWRGSPASSATAADPPAPLLAPAKAPKENLPAIARPAEPVATIFGDVPISREAFADHLIRRYGKKELELFVNKQIIAQAFGKKGWTIRADDVTAALDEDCKSLGLTRERFTKEVLPRHGKTLEEWTEDVIIPRLMLAQLLKEKRPITEADLRRAFDDKYGEKVECRVIVWSKDQGDEARRAAKGIGADATAFDCVARALVSSELWIGRHSGFPRHPGPDARADLIAASKLKPGEISPLVETKTGFLLIRCREIIPAEKDKSFDAEKPALLAEVARAQVERETQKLFDELKQQANPKYHLTLPEPVVRPNPAPTPAPK
jgi:RNA polymerase sigma factor (sigma-70 family)